MAASVKNRPGTKAKVKFVRMSASKARVVLNLVRGKQVGEALEILQFSERLASQVIEKALRSAIANAEHNEDISEDELYVSACFADEGPTLKRFRPRARGRAGRIHKQTCHITVEVSRLTDDELDVIRTSEELKSQTRSSKSSSKSSGGDRAARVAKSKAAAEPEAAEDAVEEVAEEAVEEAAEAVTEEATEAVEEATEEVADAEETAEAAAEEAVEEGATDEEVTDGETDDDAGVK